MIYNDFADDQKAKACQSMPWLSQGTSRMIRRFLPRNARKIVGKMD
jgi:hypothetical protein